MPSRWLGGPGIMDAATFVAIRGRLGKTQRELSHLLGTSMSAIHSYEQGWRNVPAHAERQLLFLLARKQGPPAEPCWVARSCPPERRERCPAFEFRAGDLCWFINGTVCEGVPRRTWTLKMELCRECVQLRAILEPAGRPAVSHGAGVPRPSWESEPA